MKRILLVVNPVSGGKRKDRTLHELLALQSPEVSITPWLWRSAEALQDLSATLAQGRFDAVAALGGDGTLNLVAQQCMHTGIPMMILPAGSGNGLARHLALPLDPLQAFRACLEGKISKMDTGTVNGQAFLCTSGIGLDAEVGHAFASSKSRGFANYVRLTMQTLMDYSPIHVHVQAENQEWSGEALAVTVANASQYGNNAQIAPGASVTDGLLDIVILKKMNLVQATMNAHRLFDGSLPTAPFYLRFQASSESLHKWANASITAAFQGGWKCICQWMTAPRLEIHEIGRTFAAQFFTIIS